MQRRPGPLFALLTQKSLACPIGQFFTGHTCTSPKLPQPLIRARFELRGETNRKSPIQGLPVSDQACFHGEVIAMYERAKVTKLAARSFLAMALIRTALNLPPQSTPTPFSNPAPVYPEFSKHLPPPYVSKVT